MNLFDDTIPEEQERDLGDLVALLRQAHSHRRKLIESSKQDSIARVAMHLASREQDNALDTEKPPEKVVGSFGLRSESKPARVRWTVRLVSALVAVLVISTLIGSTVLLFAQHMHSQSGPISRAVLAGPVGKPVPVDVQWDGLEMSMSVTPGPYFLGELLSVDISLTNRAHQTLILAGTPTFNVCSSSLGTEQTGGTSPHYTLYTMPVPPIYSCPNIAPGIGPALVQGQTVTGHFYQLLASSGDVTLTGNAFFYISEVNAQGVTEWQRSPGPLTGHLPTQHIQVAPQVPPDRMLSLQEQGSDVVIHAPAGTQLLSHTYFLCQDSQQHLLPNGNASGDWELVSTNILHRPACSQGRGLTIAQWKYAIGAVGYAVVQGQYAS